MLKRAFSLMEMLVVLLIVAIIAAVSAPMVNKKMTDENADGIGCLWKIQKEDPNSITFNSTKKNNKSVIIGDKKTNLEQNSNEKPRFYIKSEKKDNSQIELNYKDNVVLPLKIAFFNNSVWLSTKKIASQTNATVLGYEAEAGPNSVAIGAGSCSADGPNAISIGNNANAGASSAVAIGWDTNYNVKAVGQGSTALGTRANAGGDSSVALGINSSSSGTTSIAIGNGANTGGDDAIAIGNSVSAGANEVVIGSDSHLVKLGKCTFKNGEAYIDTLHVKHLLVEDESHTYFNASSAGVYVPASALHTSKGLFVYGNLAVSGGSLSAPSASIGASGLSVEGHSSLKTVSVKLTDGTEGNLVNGGWAPFNSGIDNVGIKSDRRLKNVGEVFTAGLNEIKKLEVFNYVYKKDSTKTPRVGVMAQDLMKIFPNAVFKGDDGFYRIRMEDMFYALVNAVKELDRKIDLLAEKQKKIDELEKQVDTLEKRLTKLEKLVKEK